MAIEPRTTGLTYEELHAFPPDNLRRELIDGELFVTPAPSTRHQSIVGEVFVRLHLWAREHGGRAFVAPLDVFLSPDNVVEPDVLFVRAEHVDRLEEQFVRSSPDIVVEVSSPSTRRRDLTRKRDLYERFGVPEYWFLDLESDRIERYHLEGRRYGGPAIVRRGGTLESPLLPGFAAAVDDLLGPAEDAV